MKLLKVFAIFLVAVFAISCQETKSIGIQMYSLRQDIGGNSENVDSIIIKIGEMGYKYVETANYFNGLIYNMKPEVFKEKLKLAGLYATSCHVRRDLSDNMDEVWAWWDECIATHKAAGIQYIIMPSMPTPETLEGLQAYCDYFNKIGEKCKAEGMAFGYHNHAYEFEKVYDGNISMYDYLVQHTDPAKVFFELDVYWCQKGGYAAPVLFDKYPGRFLFLHIKDEKELGESGTMDFKAILDKLQLAGTKYLIVEVEQYNFAPLESVKISLDFLKKF
ncbi:MAG: TIM barrel protein [Dysgonamonadaceae bacterium]|jgi:sugar phosphate isomerase/epimerase|nr:TIM barrel protein [Dysgonamonadaceae bacterium]